MQQISEMRPKSLLTILFLILFLMALPFSRQVRAEDEEGQSVVESSDEGQSESKKPSQLLFNYKSDFVSPIEGGLERRSAFIGALSVGGEFDLERMAHLKGASVQAQILAIHGASPSKVVGDAQALSNLDGNQSLSLYQAFWNQSLLQDRLSVLVGVHDI